ncbi:MAG: hypothetical protein ACRCZF_11960 [Gemmataceae bacterium]
MMKLNSADKKIWKRICAIPMWEEQLKPSLRERLLERQANAVFHRDSGNHAPMRQHMFPHMTDEQLREAVFDLSQFVNQQDDRIGINRRVWLDDPAEMAQFVSYSARTNWLREGHSLGIKSLPAAYVGVAIAVGDWAFVERTLAFSPFPLRKGDSWVRIGTYSPEAPAESDALLGYLHGKFEDAEMAMRWLETRNSSEQDRHGRECVWGLLQNDPRRFLAGLEAVRDGTRKVRGTTDLEYRLVSLSLHGYFELALNRNPALVVGWDVDQPLPWDTGLYHWRRSGVSALTEKHLEGLDPYTASRILTLPRPHWWDGLSPN